MVMATGVEVGAGEMARLVDSIEVLGIGFWSPIACRPAIRGRVTLARVGGVVFCTRENICTRSGKSKASEVAKGGFDRSRFEQVLDLAVADESAAAVAAVVAAADVRDGMGRRVRIVPGWDLDVARAMFGVRWARLVGE